MPTKMVLNEPLPRELLEKIDADAQEQNVTLNHAAVRILLDHYGIKLDLNGQPYRPTQAERFKLRVPEKLHRAIRMDAARKGGTARGIVLSTLSEHYGTDAISPERRPRKEAV